MNCMYVCMRTQSGECVFVVNVYIVSRLSTLHWTVNEEGLGAHPRET